MEPVKKDHAAKPAIPPAATAEELRKFIGQMHGKSPQEVLGEVAQSGLTRGIVTSAIGAIVILIVFTVGPFLVNRLSADTASVATAQPQQAAVQTEPVPAQASEPQAVPDESDLQKATDAMGIGETKTADPDKNPMDKRLDSLLDGVD
jgi:hypothetical protein